MFISVGQSSDCGGTFTAPTGTLTDVDANNDGEYDASLNCLWFITVEVNKVVRLTFNGPFHVEGQVGATCSYDYLEVRHTQCQYDKDYHLASVSHFVTYFRDIRIKV